MEMAPYNSPGCLLLTFLLNTYFPATYAQLRNTTQPEVITPHGRVRGTTLTTRKGRDIFAFLKVPYGQPPTGNLRFANPVAANGWNRTLDASTEASKCPQVSSSEMVQGNEDCLYVKVFTPQLPENLDSQLIPVMVYIHGGRFMMVNPEFYGPEYLLDADIVLVTVNYRLGALGFLSTGDNVATGNWGLKDQVLALKWVQKNVKFFGGDPDRVTFVGESAGAVSVHLIALSESTVGLFHRFITQSGSALATWGHKPRATYSKTAFEYGKYVGCPNETSDSLISCMRTVDYRDMVVRPSRFVAEEPASDFTWGPTVEPDIEGALLTDSPSNLFAAGKIRDLPWMSGIDRDEGLIQTTELYEDEERLHEFFTNFDTNLPTILDFTNQPETRAAWTRAVKSFYFNDDLTSNKSELLANLTRLIGDFSFSYPARKALELHHALAVNPQHFYTFNYRGTFSLTCGVTGSLVNYGVKHGDELIYLFPKDLLFTQFNETMSETDYQMVDTMVQLWTSFVINGTPRASALGDGITWEPYSAEDKYLRIGNDSDLALEVQTSFLPERMRFWSNIDNPVGIRSVDSDSAALTPNFLLLFSLIFSELFPS